MMNRKKILLLLGAIIILFGNSTAYAQDFPPDPSTADKNPIECFEEGNLKFMDFLSASISHDGLLEYWIDIFGRNRCQQQDIDGIVNKLDKTRANIRQAFYNCEEEKAIQAGKTYNELISELYYVRYVVDGDPEAGSPYENTGLYAEMKSDFVDDKEFFTEEEFDKLFDKFENKYKERKMIYLDCEDPVFDELVAKWDEFINGMGGIKGAVANVSEKIDKAKKRLEDTPAGLRGNMLWGFLDFKINDLDPLAAFDQMFENIKQSLPFADTGLYPQGQGSTFELYQQEASRYALDLNEAEFLANYDFLYRNTTDSLRQALENKLKSTNTTIQETFGSLNAVAECVQTISFRQCKSSH